jgi:hypothetical protein
VTTHLRNSRKGAGNPSKGKLFREIYSFLEGTTENVSLSTPMKSSARLLNLNVR